MARPGTPNTPFPGLRFCCREQKRGVGEGWGLLTKELHDLKVKIMFYLVGFLRTSSREADGSEGLPREVGEEPGHRGAL